MADRVNWFEIPVEDLARASGFYTKVLDCPAFPQPGQGFAVLAYEPGEVSGCLVQCENMHPSRDGVLIYLNVQGRLAEAVSRARACGGTVVEDIHPIGPYGERAIVIDTEGNRVALHAYPA